VAGRAQHFYFLVDNLREARGKLDSVSFRGDSPQELATQIQSALREPALFERWRALQPDPEEVDPALGATDSTAVVNAKQTDLNCSVDIVTVLPHAIIKHRMTLLIGSGWTLRDVTGA
jgi:hypothetical protein